MVGQMSEKMKSEPVVEVVEETRTSVSIEDVLDEMKGAREAAGGTEPEEDVDEDDEARRHRRLRGRAVLRVLLRADAEQLLPEAQVDAQIGQHAPGEHGGRGEDGLVVGGEHSGEKDGEQVYWVQTQGDQRITARSRLDSIKKLNKYEKNNYSIIHDILTAKEQKK